MSIRVAVVFLFAALDTISPGSNRVQGQNPCPERIGPHVEVAFVPSAAHPTIQRAVCAVRDQGTVVLQGGVYDERIQVRGKHVNIEGRGAQDRSEMWPVFSAPTPETFVTPGRAQGTVEVEEGGSLTVRKIRFVGGDAQILVSAGAESLDVKHAIFEGAWRGILHLSDATLRVEHASFLSQLHNGISFNPSFFGPSIAPCTKNLFISHSFFQIQANVAVLIKNCGPGTITPIDALFLGLTVESVEGIGAGGVLLVNSGPLYFNDLHVKHASVFGIAAVGSSLTLTNSTIENTHEDLVSEKWGDGVVASASFGVPSIPSSLSLTNVQIQNSDRAGLSNFGSLATLTNVTITCAALALNGEPFVPFDFEFVSGGGCQCGCPAAGEPMGPCAAVSEGIQPPGPISSTE